MPWRRSSAKMFARLETSPSNRWWFLSWNTLWQGALPMMQCNVCGFQAPHLPSIKRAIKSLGRAGRAADSWFVWPSALSPEVLWIVLAVLVALQRERWETCGEIGGTTWVVWPVFMVGNAKVVSLRGVLQIQGIFPCNTTSAGFMQEPASATFITRSHAWHTHRHINLHFDPQCLCLFVL